MLQFLVVTRTRQTLKEASGRVLVFSHARNGADFEPCSSALFIFEDLECFRGLERLHAKWSIE
jgi:hypothetical protein